MQAARDDWCLSSLSQPHIPRPDLGLPTPGTPPSLVIGSAHCAPSPPGHSSVPTSFVSAHNRPVPPTLHSWPMYVSSGHQCPVSLCPVGTQAAGTFKYLQNFLHAPEPGTCCPRVSCTARPHATDRRSCRIRRDECRAKRPTTTGAILALRILSQSRR